KAAHDRSERLDVDRRRGGLPRSQLPDAVSHHAHGQAPVLASSGDGRAAQSKSTDVTRIETIDLRPGYRISRVIRGGWQLAGGHGAVDRDQAVADLAAAAETGFITFDCADIYTGVEELIGRFRAAYARQYGSEAANRIKVHTKCVPDLELLPKIGKRDVRAIVDESLRRLRQDRLNLVQFHWWDYGIPGCVEAALWLHQLRRRGKIR